MSIVHNRYFVSEPDGPLQARIEEILDERSAALREAQVLAGSLGAEEVLYRGNRISGFLFDEHPGAVWRQSDRHEGKDVYCPDRRYRVGKEIAEKIDAIEIPDPQEAIEAVGLCRIPMAEHGGRAYFASCGYLDGRALLMVPEHASARSAAEEERGTEINKQVFDPAGKGLCEITYAEYLEIKAAAEKSKEVA